MIKYAFGPDQDKAGVDMPLSAALTFTHLSKSVELFTDLTHGGEKLKIRKFSKSVFALILLGLGVSNSQRVDFSSSIKDRNTSSPVIIGKSKWLFYSEEFIYNHDNTLKNIANISSIVNKIESQGVTVLVDVIPIKARIYERFLPYGYQLPSELRMRYSEIQTYLTKENVHSVNIDEAFLSNNTGNGTTSLYYRYDTHWSPYGASIVAQATAKRISEIVDVEKIQKFVSVRSNTNQEWMGDLCSLGTDLKNLCGKRVYKSFSYRNSDQSNDLLSEDRTPSIVVVGTSYSSIFNFVPDLAFNLQMDVLNESIPGKGFYYPMDTYLKSDTFKSNKPKVIVWEIPERFFQAALPTP